jgi:hypothetical protein
VGVTMRTDSVPTHPAYSMVFKSHTMKRSHLTAFLLAVLALCGCQHPRPAAPEPTAKAIRPSSPSAYPSLVGQRIELVGVVTETKCPQILGVDLWGLEDYRGRTLSVSGILRQEVVTQAQIDEKELRRGGPFANRGPGTFYHLDDLKYVRTKPTGHASHELLIVGWAPTAVEKHFGKPSEKRTTDLVRPIYNTASMPAHADEQWIYPCGTMGHRLIFLSRGRVVLALEEWSDF